MLLSYTVSNFLSFKDEVTVSLLTGKQEGRFVTKIFDESNVSLITSVFGSNASGKSNLLKPLVLLAWLLERSYGHNVKSALPVVAPHAGYDGGITDLRYIFSFEQKIYRYELRVEHGFIIDEELSCLNPATKRYSYCVKRNWIKEQESFDVKSNLGDLDTNNRSLKTRKNASILALMEQMGYQKFSGIIDSVQIIKFDTGDHTFDLLNFLQNSSMFGHDSLASRIYRNENLKNFVSSKIAEFDLGLTGIHAFESKTENESGEEVTRYFLNGLHGSSNKPFVLPFAKESGGTQNLARLLTRIFTLFNSGGILVIDELEDSLHPLMVEHIIKLFADEEANVKKAQLIFTTHYAEIMNRLEKSQIYFVEKVNGCSESYSLNDIQDVRNEHNFAAKYLAGVYGAIPNPQ